MWQEESLLERSVVLEGGPAGRGGGSCGTCLRLLEDPLGTLAGGNGATLWDCSLALTRFLVEHYNNNGYFLDDDDDDSTVSVLELGAGLGLVGMALAATMGMGAHVVVTERELALPLLTKNVEHNQGVTTGGVGRVEVTELTWGADTTQALLAERERKGQPSFDIVVASDLIFPSNVDAYPSLADTFRVLLQSRNHHPAGDKKALELWQSYEPRRPEVEAQFWTMLEDRGIRVHRLTVAEDGLPPSHPEDIMILKLTLDDGGTSEAGGPI